MAKRIVSVTTITPTATADSANLVDATYPNIIQGGSSTQRNRIWEIFLGGQAGSSTPSIMVLARDSQVASGANSNGSGQKDAAIEAATAALAAPALTGNTNATNKPQRSSTQGLMNLSFNAFGGVIRWVAAPEEVVDLVGNSASLGEVSLSAFTGGTTGAMGTHMIYETF